MTPFWIRFEPMEVRRFTADGKDEMRSIVPWPFDLGMGVTARDEADAIYLAAFTLGERKIAAISPVADVGTLDQEHVRPNMGNILVRGVWWPRGYERVGQRAPGRGTLIPFHAIIDVGDPGGVHKRVTVEARDLDEAKARCAAEYGGSVVSLWVDEAFERPR